MNLFDELKSHPAIPPFLSKRGLFVVDDTVGITLLLSSAFIEKKQKYIVVTSNLYKAQKLYSLLISNSLFSVARPGHILADSKFAPYIYL